MAKSKLEELFEILSEKERQHFILYLDSPFFKSDDVSKTLFNTLLQDKIPEADFKQTLYKRAFPGKRYNDKEMRYYISGLNKHLEKFLAVQQLENPQVARQIAGKVLAERDCEKAFMMLHNELEESTGRMDAAALLEKYMQAELYLNYTGKKLTAKRTPDYSATLKHLDSFYILKKLQLSCELTNLSNILKKSYKIQLAEEIQSLCIVEPFSTTPSIQIYYHILKFLSDPGDETSFLKSEELIKLHSDKFSVAEVFELYQYIKNYCVRKVNQGNITYLQRLFNIYKNILNNKPLMKHDYLSQWEFKNIVSISLRLNEKKWCEEFITRYINYLKPEERENALAYNLAYSWFINDEYKKAIRKLQEVELKEVFYQLDARVILLKCYFELDETESFFYQVSSFRLFLLRNKSVSEYQKNIYRNLIKFLAAIVRAGMSKAKLRKIKAELEKEKNVADLNWLYTKIDIALGE